MGQYVYEQLIPVTSASRMQPLVDLAIDKPAFLSANTLGLFATSNVDIQSVNNDFILLKDTLNPDVHKYIKVIYTDGIQWIANGGGSDGYGYSNNTGSSDIELIYDFSISSDGTAWIYEKSSDTLTLDKSGILSQESIPGNYKNSKNVIIGDKVTSIGNNAFYNCSGLKSIKIPNSVTSIGNNAFERCTGLTAVHISDLSTWYNIDFSNIYANPLYCAKNLYLNDKLVTKLVIPNDVTEIKDYAFSGCSGLTSIEIPNSVTSIGYDAFYNCSGLKKVVIGNSVTSIGMSAFDDCSGLTSIICKAVTPPTLSSSSFSGVSKSIPLYVPEESVETYKAAQYWSNFTNIQAIIE